MAQRNPFFTTIWTDRKSKREMFFDVERYCRRKAASVVDGLRAFDETGNVCAGDLIQSDFRAQILDVSDMNRRAGDVLKAKIAPVKLFNFALRNVNRDRDILESVANERETCVVRLNSGIALSAERRVHEEELPGRGSFSCDDRELSTIDMDVARLISHCFDGGTSRAEMKIRV